MTTVNLKNNRDETVAGDFTFEGDVIIDGTFSPNVVAYPLPMLNANHYAVIEVFDGLGGSLGYVKVYAHA